MFAPCTGTRLRSGASARAALNQGRLGALERRERRSDFRRQARLKADGLVLVERLFGDGVVCWNIIGHTPD
jgi:hypothetical protein